MKNNTGSFETCRIKGLESLVSPSENVKLPEVRPSDIAVLLYSSGTTGVPKGVMLSHRNLVTNIIQLTDRALIDYSDPTEEFQETVLTVLPFFHIYGFNTILNYMTYIGAHLVTIPKFTPQDYIACLENHKPTVLFVVPSLLLLLITHPEVTPQHLSSVKKIFCGAAPMKKGLIDQFFKKIGRNDCTVSQGSAALTALPTSLTHSFTSHLIRPG
jgi:4-coumarate--CoA ligase